MATQGIVSVVENGQVIIKVVAGCSGYEAKKLAGVIKKKKLRDIKSVYNAATVVGFGCRGCNSCLVVMDKERAIFEGGEAELDSLYRETFNDAKFNPRWKYGTADYIEIIEV